MTNNSLTTKGYVDDGLRYIYNRYEPVKTTVGDANSGLVKDVNDLKSAVSTTNTGLLDRVTALENASTPGAISALEQTVGTQGDGTTTQSTGLIADIEDLQSDVSDLQTTVGDANSGLVKDVADLQNTAKEYIGGTGITVTDGTGNDAGKKVIAADVVSQWNPSVLTQQQNP